MTFSFHSFQTSWKEEHQMTFFPRGEGLSSVGTITVRLSDSELPENIRALGADVDCGTGAESSPSVQETGPRSMMNATRAGMVR